ncbi:MAG: hypothetical protein MZV63_63765 [Marinilabiliales bacterium]|nr:hypothetical protein [Marinilabiliales bacterium]
MDSYTISDNATGRGELYLQRMEGCSRVRTASTISFVRNGHEGVVTRDAPVSLKTGSSYRTTGR